MPNSKYVEGKDKDIFMSIPEMTPQQKYEQFIKTNPKYKNLSMDKVCSIMIEQKVLSPHDAEELKKPLFGSYSLEQTPSFIEDNLSYIGIDIKKDSKQPQNYVEKPKTYHPRFKELEITKDGKADLNQFTIQNLKLKYDSKNYTITKNENGLITVTKKDGTPVMSVNNNFFGGTNVSYNNDGKILQLSLTKNGEIEGYSTKEIVNGTEIYKRYEKTNINPSKIYEKYPDGSFKQTNYDKTGKITFQDYWKKDGGSAEWVIEYSDGKPYKKTTRSDDRTSKTEYFLVNDLEKDITAKNSLGLPTTRSSLSDNVLKRITWGNVEETLEEYEKKTGRNLIEDIDNEIGLSRDLRDKLINHIETLYCKSASGEESGKYLAKKLFDDIQGLGSGKLADHIKMINPENLKYVLTEYKILSRDNNWNKTRNIGEVLSQLETIPGIKFDYKTDENIAEKLAPIEGLLTAIQDEWGLNQKTRNKLIKQIVDTSLNEKSPEVQTRIKRDMSEHPEDYHKIEIDIYRAENTTNGDMRNPALKNQRAAENSKNKTFDGQIEQGSTGDCWLLAGLNSAIAKPNFRNELEKLVKFDPKTGDYLVTMKGINQTYRVTKKDLQEYTALAKGSEKINSVEIAMDKYIRDEAYNYRKDIKTVDNEFGYINFVTIDANSSTFLWRTLFGDNYDLFDIKIDPLTEDFNNPDRVYEMSLRGAKGDDAHGVAKSEKAENYTIIAHHAYSIIGSDEENIYLLNPWDSEDKITITRENFKKLNAGIEIYELPPKQ